MTMGKASVILFALALSACGVAVDIGGIATGVSGASTASANTTSCMQVTGQRLLVLDHELTRGGASVTALETKCAGYRSPTCGDTIPKLLPACTGASCDQYKPSYPVAATVGYTLRFDVSGHSYAKCTVTATAGHASDTLTLVGFGVRE